MAYGSVEKRREYTGLVLPPVRPPDEKTDAS
jgi:hypothetical protein